MKYLRKFIKQFWKAYTKPIKPHYPTKVTKHFNWLGIRKKRHKIPAFSIKRWLTTSPKRN